MADYDMNALLKSYGAPLTNDNANRAREFFASNPDLATKRAAGLPRNGAQDGGDNSDLLDKMLNHTIAQTDAGPQAVVQPDSNGVTPQVGTAPQLPKQAMPKPAPVQQADRDTIDAGPRGSNGSGGSGDSSWGLPSWLLGALGLGSTAGRGMMGAPQVGGVVGSAIGKQLTGPNPNMKRIGYEPKLEDNMSDLSRLGIKDTTKPPTVSSSPENEKKAKTAQVQAEVDADNRAQDALMQEQMKKIKAQQDTDALLRAARAATGRR